MSKHFYLTKTNLNVPLSDSYRGCVIVADEKEIVISRPVERMWVYWLYGGVDDYGEQYIQKWLHEKYPWMTREKASVIIQSFKESHPASPPECLDIDLLDFEWIEHFHPKGYVLPIPFYQLEAVYPEFKITKTKEKEILKIVIKNNDQASKKILQWFNKNKRDNYEAWTRKDVQAMAVSTAIQYGAPLEKYGYGIDLDDEIEVKSEANLDANLDAKVEAKLLKKKVEVVEKQTDYMSFQAIDAKTKLLAKNGFWNFTVSQNKYNFSASWERFFAYMIFNDENMSCISQNLRSWNKKITPDGIKKFIQYFKDTHPLIEEQFQLESIPLYADEEHPLEIINPFSFLIQLSKKQENELIQIILSDEENRFDALKIWFCNYRLQYRFEPKRKEEEWVDQELVIQFCIQHGICYERLKKPKSEAFLYSIDSSILEKRNAKIAERQPCNYMILQGMDVKVKLLAKDDVWNFTVFGKKYSLSTSQERLFAYKIFNNENIYSEMQYSLHKNNLTRDEIKKFTQYFKDTHPLIEEKFQLESVPLYADEEHPLEIPNQYFPVQLSKRQEELLIRIALSDGMKQREILGDWFSQYLDKCGFEDQYGNIVAHELTWGFCMQHGINYRNVGQVWTKHDHERENKKMVENLKFLLFILAIVAFYCGVIWFCWWGMSNLGGDAHIVCGLAVIFLVGGPIYLIFR